MNQFPHEESNQISTNKILKDVSALLLCDAVTGSLVPDVSRQHAALICNSRNVQVTLKGKGSGPRCTVAPYRYIDQQTKKK